MHTEEAKFDGEKEVGRSGHEVLRGVRKRKKETRIIRPS